MRVEVSPFTMATDSKDNALKAEVHGLKETIVGGETHTFEFTLNNEKGTYVAEIIYVDTVEAVCDTYIDVPNGVGGFVAVQNGFDVNLGKHAVTRHATYETFLPAGYKVESLPFADKKLESPFGQYEVKVQQEAGKVLVKRRLQVEAVDLPASEYGAFSNFYREVAKWDAAKMVLVSGE